MDNLLKALDCENESVIIDAFMERYEVSRGEAQSIFNETKKWLWLASQSKNSESAGLVIDRSLIIIDEMWHTFILHTVIYYNYCISTLKRLIHHIPTPESEKLHFKVNAKKNNQLITEQEAKIKKQYSLVYEHLGEETLVKWYDTFASKYTPEYLDSIKKY